jgi:hypothetical protein
LVSGYSPDRQKLEQNLSDLTGGRVVIKEVKPYITNTVGSGGQRDEKSIVTATVIYEKDRIVDFVEIQKQLMRTNDQEIIVHEDAVTLFDSNFKLLNKPLLLSLQSAYKAENRVLFWLLILLALLLALGILTLLLCCICSWCPLYAASR